jgi:transcriptional regulator with XRE-family HTH domain
MTFAESLRQRRRDAGLTQDQLARKAGLSTNALHHYERGGTCPGIDGLKALAKALDAPLADLLACDFPVDQRRAASRSA